MSIHFQGGRLEVPVEAVPDDNGNWHVHITPGRPPLEFRGDLFDTHFPQVPNPHEFRRWDGVRYEGTFNVIEELDTHDWQIARTEEELAELPRDSWVLSHGSAMRPDHLPDVWVGWHPERLERHRSWPLVALVPKN